MAQQLFIPSKIRVGFQQRNGTFTGKLAYVIYYDEKGKLRKEKSWGSWRDKNIEPVDFENKPMKGFIFNKGMQRSSEWFGSGRTVFRVYAPHDFEFEINSDNLINLLMHSDVSKREVLEECVFAWSGTELVLLPTNSVDYQASITYTQKQETKVSTKELVKGRRYYQKKSNDILTYIGFFDWWEFGYEDGKRYSYGQKRVHSKKGKKHIFWNGTSFDYHSASILSSVVDDEIVDNYAELVDNFFSTINSQPITKIEIRGDVTPPIQRDYGNGMTYITWPIMHNLEGDRLCQTYLNTSYIRENESFNFEEHGVGSKNYTQIFLGFKDNSIAKHELGSTYMSYQYECGWRSDRKKTATPILQEFHTMIRGEAEKEGINFNTITPEQYVQIMTNLGYGRPVYILENGKEANVLSYYD